MGLRASAHDAVSASLRSHYGSVDALLTDSGTSALMLALRHLLPSSGTVAYPAYGCIDLTTAALGAGARVRLYDVDPATLSPDLDSLRATMRRGVDAIVVAHLYGYPADMAAIRDLATEYGVSVIEDAAQGAGGTFRNQLLGSFGDVAILSFARGKGTTGGSGGAVLVRTPAFAECTRRARRDLPGASRGGMEVANLAALRLLSHPYLYVIPSSIPALKLGQMIYHPPREPRAMSATAAAILRCTLRLEAREVSSRRAHAKDLISLARGSSGMTAVRSVAGGESGFLRLALIDKTGMRMPETDLGVLRGYPMTLDEHTQLQPLLRSGERAGKGSQFLRDRLFTLPTHSSIRDLDFTRITAWLDNAEVGSQALVSAS
jgi:perosamine synthetase